MRKILSLFLMGLLLVSCGPPKPTTLFTLPSDFLARRQMTTRQFDTNDERKILSASAQVIQDMGFTIDESETKLGLITASRRSEIERSTGAAIGHFGLSLLGAAPDRDIEQTISITLVTTKNRAGKGFNVRVEMSRRVDYEVQVVEQQGTRRVVRTERRVRFERIDHQPTFQDFFNRLGQSLFLEGHNI
jgi:hypothetical protein